MGKQRPRYPDDSYPKLRKEENFGCAKCGVPLVTIHHIEGFKEDIIESLDKLILLCDKHHKEADDGKITKPELYQLKKKPFNSDMVNHKLKVSSNNKLVVHIGGNVVIDTPNVLRIHGENIISVRKENDNVLFTTKFYDKNNNLKMEMIDNVWSADIDLTDVRYSEGQVGTECFLAVKFSDSEPYLETKIINGELHIQGKFYKDGVLFDVRDDGTFALGKAAFFTGNTIERCGAGIVIG